MTAVRVVGDYEVVLEKIEYEALRDFVRAFGRLPGAWPEDIHNQWLGADDVIIDIEDKIRGTEK